MLCLVGHYKYSRHPLIGNRTFEFLGCTRAINPANWSLAFHALKLDVVGTEDSPLLIFYFFNWHQEGQTAGRRMPTAWKALA